MKKTFMKYMYTLGAGAGALGLLIAPQLSFADTMTSGYMQLDTKLAMTICSSLPAVLVPMIPICNGQAKVYQQPVSSTPSQQTMGAVMGFSASGIYGQGAQLTWQTNQPTNTMAWYRPSGSLNWIPVSGSAQYSTNHSLSLSGLTGNTPYELMVGGNVMSGTTLYSGTKTFSTNTLSSNQTFSPTFSSSGIQNNGATINFNSSSPIRTYVTYGYPGSTSMMTAYSAGYGTGAYNMQSPITVSNLNSQQSYQGQAYALDQSGNVVGVYDVSWGMNQ